MNGFIYRVLEILDLRFMVPVIVYQTKLLYCVMQRQCIYFWVYHVHVFDPLCSILDSCV